MAMSPALRAVLEELTDRDRQPAPGSAAAVLAAVGTSLLARIASEPTGGDEPPATRAERDRARQALLVLRDQLFTLVDRPTGDEAPDAALEVIQTCERILTAAAPVGAAASDAAQADLAVANAALGAALQSAWLHADAAIAQTADDPTAGPRLERLKDAMTDGGKAAAALIRQSRIVETMQAAAKRGGFPHGHSPTDPKSPDARAAFARAAAESLLRLHTPAARKALSALAVSGEATIADRASEAIERWNAS